MRESEDGEMARLMSIMRSFLRESSVGLGSSRRSSMHSIVVRGGASFRKFDLPL